MHPVLFFPLICRKVEVEVEGSVFAISDEPISARKSFKNFAAKPVVRNPNSIVFALFVCWAKEEGGGRRRKEEEIEYV